MWQLLLTALVAGSTAFIAKHIFTNHYSPIEKCEEEESLQEYSHLFGWGLGVGIMYMMYAGKAEISKPSTSMEVMSKVVHELRTELYKRKSAHVATSSKDNSTEKMQLLVNRTNTVDRESSGMKMCGLPIADDVEYPSSVLTEEPEPAVLEMDQLEAGLQSELCKNFPGPALKLLDIK